MDTPMAMSALSNRMSKIGCIAASLCVTLISFPALAGVATSGGGNALVGKPASPEAIQLEIHDLRFWHLEAYFKGLEVQFTAAPLYEKRFGGEPTPEDRAHHALIGKFFTSSQGRNVWEVLPAIHWDIRTDAPCIDGEGKESDGSASLPDTVCLSIPRLSLKLDENGATRAVFALMVHEVSHLFGTSEAEAEALQSLADAAFARAGADSGASLRPYLRDLSRIQTLLHSARRNLREGVEFSKVCERFHDPENPIASFYGESDALFGDFAAGGAQEYLKLNAVVGLGAFVLPYIHCNPQLKKLPPTLPKEMRLADFLHQMFQDSIGPVEPMVSDEEMLQLTTYGEREALDAELARMSAYVDSVLR